jgi:squalene-hopene/tetraprenyl-beta-curcumene cyclase
MKRIANMRTWLTRVPVVAFAVWSSIGSPLALPAQEAAAHGDTRAETIAKGLAYLREHGQGEDGSFSSRMGPGLTGLALTAALRNGLNPDDPMVAKGLAALESFVKPDGGIYGSGRIKNYETCVAIVAFQLANKNGRYKSLLDNAERFVRGLQVGASDNADESNLAYGGVGYGGPERPDLSNTAYLIDAIQSLDASADDQAIQRALVFVSRCQNLKSDHNDTQFADKVNDGGFYYLIPTEAVDPSEDDRYTANGGLRSYGSMTYAGFKSMVYAGLTKEDPRVKAALEWIGMNYSVEENPGVGDAGLYYYYHTFAAALNASQLDALTDGKGQSHDWRRDLVSELARRQAEDGSWSNTNRQWFEDDKNLATSFALIALSYCGEPKRGN